MVWSIRTTQIVAGVASPLAHVAALDCPAPFRFHSSYWLPIWFGFGYAELAVAWYSGRQNWVPGSAMMNEPYSLVVGSAVGSLVAGCASSMARPTIRLVIPLAQAGTCPLVDQPFPADAARMSWPLELTARKSPSLNVCPDAIGSLPMR